MVHLRNEKLNYHFKGGDPSVVSEPRRDNTEGQDVEEKARGWASGSGRQIDGGRAARTWVKPGVGESPGASTGGGRGSQCHLLSHRDAPA